jgi:FlaG/FlaF family flagellin (archaellin)
VRFNKKAVTPAISWILLIGLTVTMAGVVTVWIKSTAGETTEALVNNVDKDMRCVDTSFNAYENNSIMCANTIVHNRGFFSIHSIKVRNGNQVEDYELTDPIAPQEIRAISLNISNLPSDNKIGLIPIIKVQDEFLACMAKEISIECTPQ